MIMFDNVPKFESLTDARKIFGILKVLIDFSVKARKEGILALEEGLENNSGLYENLHGIIWDYFKTLMRLLVDGNEPGKIEMISKYLVSTTNANSDVILAMMIISEGILSIQEGDNPIVMRELLLSMLGWDGRKECIEYLKSVGAFVAD